MKVRVTITGEFDATPGEPGWEDCSTPGQIEAFCKKILDQGIVGENEVLDWCEWIETEFEVVES
jgi:hypothetical protein